MTPSEPEEGGTTVQITITMCNAIGTGHAFPNLARFAPAGV